MSTLTLYEVEVHHSNGEEHGSFSHFVGFEHPAKRYADAVDGTDPRVPDGHTVENTSVFRCSIEDKPPRAMLYALLNGDADMQPQRIALVYGALPLPLKQRS